MPADELGRLIRFCSANFKRDHRTPAESFLSASGEVCEEAGELFGKLKKYCYYAPEASDQAAKFFDEARAELCDTLACLMNVADMMGIEGGSLVDETVMRLRQKWPQGFSPERGAERHA